MMCINRQEVEWLAHPIPREETPCAQGFELEGEQVSDRSSASRDGGEADWPVVHSGWRIRQHPVLRPRATPPPLLLQAFYFTGPPFLL